MIHGLAEFTKLLRSIRDGLNVDLDTIKNIEFDPPLQLKSIAEDAYRDAIFFASDYDIFVNDREHEKNWRARIGWHLERIEAAQKGR